MIQSAILIANFVVTGIVLILGSAYAWSVWRDRGLDSPTHSGESFLTVLSLGFIFPLLAFLYPLSEIIIRATHGN